MTPREGVVQDPGLEEAARLAGSTEPEQQRRLLALCAEALARAAGGTPRVAILRLLGGEEFVFAHPPELVPGNRFPARPSLAGRALSGGLVENAVAERARFSLYESLPQPGGAARVIQKMIALPVPGPDGPIGAVQISRSGPSPAAAGPDFVEEDLQRAAEALSRFAPLLGRLWAANRAGS